MFNQQQQGMFELCRTKSDHEARRAGSNCAQFAKGCSKRNHKPSRM